MPYHLQVESHPLGVVVIYENNQRELLIEGEVCCGIDFAVMKKAAETQRQITIEDDSSCLKRLNGL